MKKKIDKIIEAGNKLDEEKRKSDKIFGVQKSKRMIKTAASLRISPKSPNIIKKKNSKSNKKTSPSNKNKINLRATTSGYLYFSLIRQ